MTLNKAVEFNPITISYSFIHSKNPFYFSETLLKQIENQIACVKINIEIRIESLKFEFEKFENQSNKKIRRIRGILLKNETKPSNLRSEFKRFKLLSKYIGRLHMEN